ncbi:MAG TPA: PIG-L family deacetylase [Verrucomicrobiae bacterium]|jgi:LmbE family N-acetylglucosaminyl deacetylase|nr:PIG-L family deacetylase [Verrucomicrobiae bacterium]
MNPYQQFVSAFVQLAAESKSLPLGGIPPHASPPPQLDAPVALIFSPHPDDECIIGGLALRLMREKKFRIVNVAVTLGSNKERREARLTELKNACHWIGFELAETGLEKITPAARTKEPEAWMAAVRTIARLLAKFQPAAIFFPHELDWNGTHVGTHHLIKDALKTLPPSFTTTLIETEFWGQMPSPNLMVELSASDVADLLAALSFHVGELQRNPYHLRMPAWLQDNVRRGTELVGGQGGTAPDFVFATLYRVHRWHEGCMKQTFAGGKIVGATDELTPILG